MRRKDGQIFYHMYVHITHMSTLVFPFVLWLFIIIGVGLMDGILEVLSPLLFLLVLEGMGMGMYGIFVGVGGVCWACTYCSHRYCRCKLSRVN